MTYFRELLAMLSKGGVEYILIGGAAATAHGASRLTRDVDVVYRRTDENISRLSSALKDNRPYLRGAPLGLPFVWDSRTIKNGFNFTLTTSFGDLDLLATITGGGSYEELLPFTQEIEVYGIVCRCLNLDKLIQVKRAAGRPKDFEAIAELEALRDERRASDSSPS